MKMPGPKNFPIPPVSPSRSQARTEKIPARSSLRRASNKIQISIKMKVVHPMEMQVKNKVFVERLGVPDKWRIRECDLSGTTGLSAKI